MRGFQVDFYEKVRVKENASFPEHVGLTGVVGGISEGADGVTYYAIKLDDDDVVMFPEDQLEPLGEAVSPEELFPGGSVRVTVDEEGRSEIVEDNPPRQP